MKNAIFLVTGIIFPFLLEAQFVSPAVHVAFYAERDPAIAETAPEMVSGDSLFEGYLGYVVVTVEDSAQFDSLEVKVGHSEGGSDVVFQSFLGNGGQSLPADFSYSEVDSDVYLGVGRYSLSELREGMFVRVRLRSGDSFSAGVSSFYVIE